MTRVQHKIGRRIDVMADNDAQNTLLVVHNVEVDF